MIDSKLTKFAAMTASWTAEVNAEVEEAIGILRSANTDNTWWMERLAHNMTADKGPSYDAANGSDTGTTLLEIAFWSGWLKGEQDTLKRLMGTVAMLLVPGSPEKTQTGKKCGRNDFLEGLR